MNSRTRKLVLALFVILFLLMGPGAVLYAYGWRIDTQPFRLLKVGGIFLSGMPSDAKVLLDNAPAGERHHLLTGSFLSNLLPRTYRVEIAKDGFRGWKKTVEVAPSGVSSFAHIVLVPEKIWETELLEKPIVNFWINDSRLIYEDARGSYFITDTENLEERTNLGIVFNNLKQKQLKYPGYVRITDIAPTDDPDQWIIQTANAKYLLDVDELTLTLFKGKVPAPVALPKDRRIPDRGLVQYASKFSDDAHLLLQYSDEVYLLELDDRDPLNMPLVADGVKKHVYDNGRLYLLRGNSLSYAEL